jgi:hypothetical protein
VRAGDEIRFRQDGGVLPEPAHLFAKLQQSGAEDVVVERRREAGGVGANAVVAEDDHATGSDPPQHVHGAAANENLGDSVLGSHG